MKKSFIVILLAVSLAGCGSGETANQNTQQTQETQEASVTQEPIGTLELTDTNSINGLTVDITNIQPTTLDDGRKVIRVEYNFINNSEETTTFDDKLTLKSFQDDVELNHIYDTMSTGVEGDNFMKEVKPGGSIEIVYLYETKSETPIEVEMKDWNGEVEPIKLGTYTFE